LIKRRQSLASGFTLIEIMIALFIFAIISMIISYGLNNVFTAKQKISIVEKRLNELQFALLLMQHDTSQLIDYTSPSTPSSTTTGNNTQFSFVTTNNANPMGLEQRSNLMHVSYLSKNNQLIRNIWFNEPATSNNMLLNMNSTPQVNKQLLSRVLLNNVTNLKFRYLSSSGFIDTWPPPNLSSQTPPLAIQISFNVPEWGNITQLYRIQGVTLATS